MDKKGITKFAVSFMNFNDKGILDAFNVIVPNRIELSNLLYIMPKNYVLTEIKTIVNAYDYKDVVKEFIKKNKDKGMNFGKDDNINLF